MWFVLFLIVFRQVTALRFLDLVNHTNTFDLDGEASECFADISRLVEDVLLGKEWAMKVLDSWGGVPSGVYDGNTIDYGDFDQCLASKSDSFTPAYCLVPVSGRGFDFETAVCMPDSCTTEMVQDVVNSILTQTKYLSTLPVEQCMTSKGKDFGIVEYISVVLVGLVLLLALVSTLYDMHEQDPRELYTAFSLVRNWPKLVDTTPNKEIPCMTGMRAVVAFWIVITNFYVYMGRSGSDWFTVVGYNGADTFFVMSGFCAFFSLTRNQSRRVKLSLLELYVHRYIRLTPTKILVTSVIPVLYKTVQHGPVFMSKLPGLQENCKENLTAFLLYYQNYWNSSNPEKSKNLFQCLPVSWYTDVDFHMYLLSPLLFVGFLKFGRNLMFCLLGLAAVSTFYVYLTCSTSICNDLPSDGESYLSTHTRFPAWIFGFYLGYILYQDMHASIVLGKTFGRYLLLISLSCLILVALTGSTALMYPLKRLIWGLATCGIIYTCVHGHGGVVNWFLSLPLWKPLARLGFAVYLVNWPVILLSGMLLREELRGYLMAQMSLGVYMMTVLLAIPVTLLVEMPFVSLESDWRLEQKIE